MQGFIISNSFSVKQQKIEGFITEKKEWNNIQISRKTAKKFINDKVFFENEKYIVLIDGFILNSQELKVLFKDPHFENVLFKMYEESKTFFSQLEGSFSGVFIDKKEKTVIAFANKIGDRPLFYWVKEDKYIISSNLKDITTILQNNNIEYTLDEVGAYCLLTHGFMLQDITLVKEVKKITAGQYLKIGSEKLNVIQYHEFKNKPNYNQTEEQIIEKIDELFTKAIEKQVAKNKEYEYDNIAPLSAGLDARMVNYALDKLAIKDVLNFSYSESGYYDQETSAKIAEELKRNWFFKSLDNGLSLYNLDKMIEINNGLVLHYGPAQVWDTFKLLNRNNIGIIHTGMLGDVIIGTFFKEKNQNKKANITDGAYSRKLINKLELKITDYNYEINMRDNQEIFTFYNRGFNGANMGSPLTFQYDCESYAPFYETDFFEYCLTIPVEIRWNHNIYDKWVLAKYPNAAKHLHNGNRKIGERNNVKFFGKETNYKKIPKQILSKILLLMGLEKQQINTKHHMNPLDYWYNTNNELRIYLDNYLHTNINILENELKKDCENLYNTGNTVEKTQVLTLISATNYLFGENSNE